MNPEYLVYTDNEYNYFMVDTRAYELRLFKYDQYIMRRAFSLIIKNFTLRDLLEAYEYQYKKRIIFKKTYPTKQKFLLFLKNENIDINEGLEHIRRKYENLLIFIHKHNNNYHTLEYLSHQNLTSKITDQSDIDNLDFMDKIDYLNKFSYTEKEISDSDTDNDTIS